MGLLDRALHPWRRKRALQALHSGETPSRLLFLCYGNICRSPYAAGRLLVALEPDLHDRFTVQSAGFFGPDRPALPEALRQAASRDVDLSAHLSRLVDPSLLEGADLVVVMERSHAVGLRRTGAKLPDTIYLGDLDPTPVRARAIADPYGRSEEFLKATFDRIDRCVQTLASHLMS